MFCCCFYKQSEEEATHLSGKRGQCVKRDDYYGITYQYWAFHSGFTLFFLSFCSPVFFNFTVITKRIKSCFHLIYLSAGMFLMMTLTRVSAGWGQIFLVTLNLIFKKGPLRLVNTPTLTNWVSPSDSITAEAYNTYT